MAGKKIEGSNHSLSRRRLLISGASGMIGTSLIRDWISNQIHVVRLVRHNQPAEQAASAPETVLWNPAARGALADPEPLERLDAAVHLSGANVAAHRWTKKYKQEIISSRIESTLALVKILTRLDRPPSVLICASAIGIYGNRGDEILAERAGPGTGFLAETCVAWEAATQAAEAAGMRVVHARFGVVLSPVGGAMARLLPIFRLGLGGRLGSGRQWMPWITLQDAVGAIHACLQDDSLHGPVNIVASHPVTNAAFTNALGAAVRRPAILPAPAFALRIALGPMADEALLASARVAPVKLLQAGYRFADPEIGPALHHLLSC